MVSFTDRYNAISIDRLPSKTKIGNVSPSSPPLQSRFKENAKILSKISTTQENITTSRQNFLFLLKTQKNNHSLASDWWENTKSSSKENVRTFSKTPPLKKTLIFQD